MIEAQVHGLRKRFNHQLRSLELSLMHFAAHRPNPSLLLLGGKKKGLLHGTNRVEAHHFAEGRESCF